MFKASATRQMFSAAPQFTPTGAKGAPPEFRTAGYAANKDRLRGLLPEVKAGRDELVLIPGETSCANTARRALEDLL